MEEIVLEAKKRIMKGKQGVRKLRNQALIPAILYGRGKESVSLEINEKDIKKIINTGSWESVVIDLKVEGDNEVTNVIIKDIQVDPIKRNLLHLDLCEISLKEKIKVHMHIETVGEAPGVKSNGGILEHITREIEIECLPTKIPESIKIDISALEIGDAITVGGLAVSDDIKIITDQERVVVKVIPPTVLEEKIEEEAPLAEAVEPEVIAKGKKEETEEEPKEEQ